MPKYHLSQIFQGVTESSDFKIERFLLVDGVGKPPLPPEYPPISLRRKIEDDPKREGGG
jgi:hypothetical protein